MRIPKAFYFTMFSALSLFSPFLTLYYEGLGLTGRQIGMLASIVPFVTLFSASVWSGIADATQKHRWVLVGSAVSMWFAVLAITRTQNFNLLIPIVVWYALSFAPILPLVDNSVVVALGAEKENYGRIRVWGSYGWALCAFVSGWIVDWAGLPWLFMVSLAIYACMVFVATQVDIHPVPLRRSFSSGFWELMGNRAWIWFLLVTLAGGMCLTLIMNYLFLYLDQMGASGSIMGYSLTIATLSEIPVFLTAHRFLKRWNPQLLIGVALAAFVVRAFAYVAMTEPWQVLPISLLHSFSFGLLWLAGVQYADDIAPEGLGTTAQGMFGGVFGGMGAALGALLGGFLYEIDPAAVFSWAGWISLAALLSFVWANWRAFRLADVPPAH